MYKEDIRGHVEKLHSVVLVANVLARVYQLSKPDEGRQREQFAGVKSRREGL